MEQSLTVTAASPRMLRVHFLPWLLPLSLCLGAALGTCFGYRPAQILPESGGAAAVPAAACISAVLTEALFFAKRRSGYIFVPLSAVTAVLLFLLLGACLPVTGWEFGCLWKAACAMTAGMSMVYLIKMNKNNKKTQRKRAGHYR